MTETLCDSGAVKNLAGANASSAITGDPTIMTQFINQAEGEIIADTRVNWVDAYAGMNADFKQVVEGATAAKAAIKVINYDMSGFTSRLEAIHMQNVLWDIYNRATKELEKSKVVHSFGQEYILT